ncbi:MAG: tRNA uridine-5-carboxymethylaminomethyl(34) synthesis enzyme MnmG [Candidatus Riflebacteria bacterium]|nr:tRNA uridine-5-carboxymethylaminomethyl(34) synthesis enzyme MnmG [Candidatus Riflebacteria bacterium]
MKTEQNHTYDVIVVGAGHAGCEAAMAAARAGASTLLCTINLDTVADLPCNPSIGGQGKAQLVREVDAMGGIMGIIADETSLQRRSLNTRKGMAVRANRFQSDKKAYSSAMLQAILKQPNLRLLQMKVTEVIRESGKAVGVRAVSGETWYAGAIIVAAGTFLNGMIHIGDVSYPAGRAGEPPSLKLTESLVNAGLQPMRFKTGTPPRINASQVNVEGLQLQEDEAEVPPFSYRSFTSPFKSKPCYITYTNDLTHEIISKNFERSAMYSGKITGMGARYCPSIEDKLKKFPDKQAHKVFLEPEGSESSEIYLQGLSTSLPEEVQAEVIRSVKGLEKAEIVRPGYAIEYDIFNPADLFPTLMSKTLPNLFLAGQVNGTSGYEEAAAQGLLAGLNAAAIVLGKQMLIMPPEQSYTGLMINDITTREIIEPYRVFTSRSPFRLNLRMSNAENRLSEIAFRYGLLTEEEYGKILSLIEYSHEALNACQNTEIPLEKLSEDFPDFNPGSKKRVSVSDLLKSSQYTFEDITEYIPEFSSLPQLAKNEVETLIKYEGYFVQQLKEFKLLDSMKEVKLDDSFYENMPKALSTEAKLKIKAVRPSNVEELSRISAVRAGDLATILISLKKA